ncbi:possible secreted polysaccharide deacetylase [Streptomyces scabiei 87.22]|uniref:Possible secreted polysaccharide deacetylase n=1 Tax=Streptomyces scabiei (strain 87.22) TaxID=680198 RepID=C9YVU5_STRSW|nr:polysaccharide deacetylase family protein [Streptomyces scabiei]MDX2576053.1 polysaccharide deacetylase family protein [Streptomyces scabiei]MDX2658146.1 polysaccharide deacetylase family protein [Streptomyces scabiei]MDX2724768.1 polysaccharide deacetylase family protein [Streptomyces scabiei]MDX2869675.1 polysaccharide deacetylase family protein [Streptomyces scabiei]MDX2885474.1 polysaccharide deacetylase family protein [Streptomyces scabiei]
MISPVRRITALCAVGVLGAALAACGTPQASTRIVTATASPSAATASRPPTLAPGPAGLTPVFEHGPRTTADKTVALTFDADMTADQGDRAAAGERFDNPELIAALRRLKVPATLFMTGRWVEEYPIQARSIGRDPLFEVANRSYSHHAFTEDCHGLPTMAPGRMRADLERAYRVFREAGVTEPMPYFRFPGGCYDSRALRSLSASGVTAVQWDVVSGDAFATDADDVVRQVLDGVRPGSVVVMHCTRSAAPVTEKAVRRIVPVLRARGYRFVKVSDLVGTAATETAAAAVAR